MKCGGEEKSRKRERKSESEKESEEERGRDAPQCRVPINICGAMMYGDIHRGDGVVGGLCRVRGRAHYDVAKGEGEGWWVVVLI